LEHEIFRETPEISLHRLYQHPRFHRIERRKVSIEQYTVSAQDQNRALDALGGNGDAAGEAGGGRVVGQRRTCRSQYFGYRFNLRV